MFLENVLKSVSKKYKNIPIRGISFNSKKTKKGDIFFAIRGVETSGIKFINEAEKKGASAIITDKNIKNHSLKIPVVKVKDTRTSFSEACSNFYKGKPKNIIAVTGTNGKSSVADFFYQIMRLNKLSAASIGTLGIKSKNYNKKTQLTSMDALSLHKNLKILRNNKIKNVILEASSHGLAQKRLNNLNIEIGIFTNFSHDHLDYHKNMQSYFNSKMYLFKSLIKKNSKMILNEDDNKFEIIKKIAKKRSIKISTIGSKFGDIIILKNKYEDDMQVITISFKSKIFSFKVPLIGYFQIKNLLMAVLAASFSGASISKVFKSIKKIKTVPGRLEQICKQKNNSNIIIDFAHTPDALEQSLMALKQQFNKEIILVFGCGGERDKKKRIIMGKVAKKFCRKVFVTDDNPRKENPKIIRKSIIKGCKNIAIDIGDRKKAIKTAIDELKANEVLLIAGKGHEQNQNYGKKIRKFSDKEVVKKIISNRDKSKNFIFNNVDYNGVSINTKTLKKNNLYFAIKGKKNDGHKFLKEALKKGASKLIVSKKQQQFSTKKIINVKNTLSALNDLAITTRMNSAARIIGITGSVGKTTLKNLTGFALENYGRVYQSPHSYNNKFGVPLSLSNLKSTINYGVFEIGMDKKREIYSLSKIVKPETAVITNISEAHLKNFNSIKDIAKAKSEIIDNILENGNIILNKDDKFFNFFFKKAKEKKINIISFSLSKKADIFLLKTKKLKDHYRIKLNVKDKIFYFNIKNTKKNFLNNILACVSILFTLNLNLQIMRKKFMNFILPAGRGDVKVIKKFNKKFMLIDESYNANPLSMKSAIENMNIYKRKNNGKKIIFLSDMLELGKKSKKLHKNLSSLINNSDIDKVYVYGKNIKETFNLLIANKKGKIFRNLGEAYQQFSKIIHNNDLLMIKGSNATGLNKFSKNIKKDLNRVI